MFDEGYCAGMTLGQPEISIEGLNEFAAVLASLGTNRKRGAQSSPSKQGLCRGAFVAVELSSFSSSKITLIKRQRNNVRKD